MKILITGGNSATALKVAKALAAHQIILADYGDIPHYQSTHIKMISLGNQNQEMIVHRLLNACLDESATILLPLHLFEIEALKTDGILFHEFDISIMLPSNQEISKFLPSQKSSNLVLKQNELLFSSINNVATTENGAFYVNEQGLSLITL